MALIKISDKEKGEAEKLELHSEQLRDIMGQMPKWVIRFGTIVILAVLLLFFLGSAFLRYPDMIKAPVRLTTQTPPADIVANVSARIERIYVVDKQQVVKNQVLVVFESGADYTDVQKLKEVLKYADNHDSLEHKKIPEKLALGTLQEPYSLLQKRLYEYFNFRKLDYHQRKINSVQSELKKYSVLLKHLEEKEKIQKRDYVLGEKQHSRDSSLYEQGVLSASQLEKSEELKLSKHYSLKNTQTELASAQIEVSKLQQEILELELKYEDNSRSYVQSLSESIEMLKGAVSQWEKDFVISSPFAGLVSLTRIWSENQYIEKGKVVLTVLPFNQGEIVGKMLVPAKGSGKIKEGYKVAIQFDNFPYLEYGIVTARVTSISLVPNDELYSVEIKPDSSILITNYKKELPFQQNMPGTAEIITDERSLLARMIEPFRSAIMKQKLL